jgi:hypothetical protein
MLLKLRFLFYIHIILHLKDNLIVEKNRGLKRTSIGKENDIGATIRMKAHLIMIRKMKDYYLILMRNILFRNKKYIFNRIY